MAEGPAPRRPLRVSRPSARAPLRAAAASGTAENAGTRTNRPPFLELENTARGMGGFFLRSPRRGRTPGEGGRAARRSSDGGRSARRAGAPAGAGERLWDLPRRLLFGVVRPGRVSGCFGPFCDPLRIQNGRKQPEAPTERPVSARPAHKARHPSHFPGARHTTSRSIRPPMHRPPRSARTQARAAARAQCAHRARRPASRRAGVAPRATPATA